MVRARTLLRVLPYIFGILFVSVFLIGIEISFETEALADAQPAVFVDTVDVQVFWFQSKACVILPPDGSIGNCIYLPLVNVMLGLTILMVAVIVVYGLLRKRVNLLQKKRTHFSAPVRPGQESE
jgi:ABC-type Co2+ transport system permease subunit